MDYLEIGKYFLGSLPALVPLLWKWRKDSRAATIKDYKAFLVELEAAHDKLLEAKEEILTLSFNNLRLQEINTFLNEKITNLEEQIEEIKRKIRPET